MPDLPTKTAIAEAPDDHKPLRSYATLVAGCEFVSRYPVMIEQGSSNRSTALEIKVHMRVTANRIRELDRFLAVMLDEAAGRIGGAGHDAEQFDRISNTSKKLRAVEMSVGMAAADHGRLRALGRIAARLRGPSHHWRARSLRVDMELVGAEGCANIDSRSGKASRSLPLNLSTISSFYYDLGRRLSEELSNKNYSP